jgi:hypothetical protein
MIVIRGIESQITNQKSKMGDWGAELPIFCRKKTVHLVE